MSPPIAVLATLILILLVPRRVPMWATFLGACLLLPPLCGRGIGESARLLSAAASDRTTWLFAGSCAGVFVLSSILTHGGHLAALCDFATALVPSRRVRVGIMPALVGLVPMPGGAVVSAPLIDRSLGDSGVPGTDRNLINYWFRHIWEVSWPLYPSVLLALGYAGAKGGDAGFLLAQGALTIVLAGAGYVALLSRVPKGRGGPAAAPPPWTRLRALVPLVVLIALPLAARASDTGSALVVVIVTVALAIGAAVATTIDVAGLSKVPFDRRIYAMTALAYLIQVFGSLVKETGASEITARALGSAGLPAFVGALALPFLAGFATGNTQTFVAMAFPVVIPGVLSAGSPLLPWLVLAYAGGFLGYLTSPVHMCLVLSTRYFNSKLLAAYGRLAVPLLAFLGAAIAIFLALGGRFDR